jgi:hypothetical protein
VKPSDLTGVEPDEAYAQAELDPGGPRVQKRAAVFVPERPPPSEDELLAGFAGRREDEPDSLGAVLECPPCPPCPPTLRDRWAVQDASAMPVLAPGTRSAR